MEDGGTPSLFQKTDAFRSREEHKEEHGSTILSMSRVAYD